MRIKKYNNGSFAYYSEKKGRWMNIPSELALQILAVPIALIKEILEDQTFKDSVYANGYNSGIEQSVDIIRKSRVLKLES